VVKIRFSLDFLLLATLIVKDTVFSNGDNEVDSSKHNDVVHVQILFVKNLNAENKLQNMSYLGL